MARGYFVRARPARHTCVQGCAMSAIDQEGIIEMIEHLEERSRWLELYLEKLGAPEGQFAKEIDEEIEAIEKKLGIGARDGDWLRDPGDRSIIFSAISKLPIRDEDDYVVVLRSELDALKKRARDVVIDQLKSLPRKE